MTNLFVQNLNNVQAEKEPKSKIPKRRPRGTIVCLNCRKRKIRCDKKSPCSNCVRHRQDESCTYEEKRTGDFKEGYMEIQFPLANEDPNPVNGQESSLGYGQRIHDPRRKILYGLEREGETELESLKKRMKILEESIFGTAIASTPSKPTMNSVQSSSDSSTPAIPNRRDFRIHSYGTDSRTFSTSTLSSGLSNAHQPHYIKEVSRFDEKNTEKNFTPTLPPLNHHLILTEESMKVSRYATSSDPSHYHQRPVGFMQPNGLEANFQNRQSSRNDVTDIRSSDSVRPFLSQMSQLANPSHSEVPFLVGVNIYSDPSDTINFYEGYSSVHHKDQLRRLNFGPFAWSSLMKRDVGLRLTWDYIVSSREKVNSKGHSAALMFAQPTDEMTDESTATLLSTVRDEEQLEKQFERRALQTDGIDDIIPYKKLLKARENAQAQTAILNKNALSLGLTVFDGKIDQELQLIERIQVVLPKKRVLWKLINRFFHSMYTYMPFLDEDYFRRDVEKIIGKEAYDDVPIGKIKIDRKLDLATVGILLVVLRLAYLSLFSNNSSLNESILNCKDPNPGDKLIQYLMRNPININIIDIAISCLDQFHILRRSNFTVLQLALFVRLYHIYAPEDGDGADGGDSQVFHSVLIQTAYSLGFNREPDEQCIDPKLNHLIRKIWVYLVASDLHLAYSFGNPPTIDERNYDIQSPDCEPGSENIRDKVKDQATTERLKWCLFSAPKLRKLLRCTLDIKGRTSLPELCRDLSEFELKLHKDMGYLSDFIGFLGTDDQIIARRNLKVKVYLALKSFLISVYFHIYLYYETNDSEVSFFYLRKCLLTTTGEIMPHYITLLGKSEVISDMIMNPTIEMIIHKSNQINLSIIVRVNFLIYHLKQSLEHENLWKNDASYLEYFQLLCQLSSAVTRAAEFTISAISKLSKRYYYAWRITKGQTFLLKTITLTKFYEDNYHKARSVYSVRYRPEQLRDLIAICEKTLSEFSQTEFCTFGFAKYMTNDLFQCNGTGAEKPSADADLESLNNAVRTTTNAEIDKLWLQVLSLKHNTSLAGGYQDTIFDSKSPHHLSMPPMESTTSTIYDDLVTRIDPITGLDRSGYDMEMDSRYDFCSEVPFEGMLDI